MRHGLPGFLLFALPALGLGPVAANARADAAEADTAVALDSLAYSMELSPEGSRAVHSLLVPLDVYRGVVSTELADLRVFDARGKELPHALRELDDAHEVELGEHELPMFALYPDPARPGESIETLALRVERDAKGTLIAIQPDPPRAAAATTDGKRAGAAGSAPGASAARVPVGYILDASQLRHPIVALRLPLPPEAEDLVLPIVIEASDDLGSFRAVASDQPLVRLLNGGARIEQSRIELPAVEARYLRVRWPGHRLPAPLAHAIAEHGVRSEAAEKPRTRVRGTARAKEPSTFDYDLGGPIPVDGVRIVLPEDNSVIEAELASYAKTGDAPEVVFRGTAYRVRHEAAVIESPLVELPRRTHRFFRLRVASKGGGAGQAAPVLELRYRPQQLLFVARGEPPYQLGYGHYAAKPSRFEPGELLSFLPAADREHLPTSDCKLGKPRARAGGVALIAPPPPPPYRRYALWGVLIAGAVALGIAALRLGRSLG